MKLRNTSFLSAMARILASASTSVIARGRASGAGDLILPGTIASVIDFQRIVADDAQHLRDLRVVGSDVAFDESVVVFEVAQGGRCGSGS